MVIIGLLGGLAGITHVRSSAQALQSTDTLESSAFIITTVIVAAPPPVSAGTSGTPLTVERISFKASGAAQGRLSGQHDSRLTRGG